MYLLRTPKILRALNPGFMEWERKAVTTEASVYLTFDDGPHPKATPFVLDVLQQYNAKATFFCLGKNVVEFPNIYDRIRTEGHSVGNHTHNHLKGWSTSSKSYVEDTLLAEQFIESSLFRPPYGRIKRSQAGTLRQKGFRIIMWSLLSGDFDMALSPERCLENVIFNLQPGDIVVFHDSEKAWERMSYVLPRVLEFCKKNNWLVAAL